MKPSPRPRQPLPAGRRGVILVVAMLMTVIIGISLLSYLRLGQANMTLSNRAFYQNAAINLAETGLEQAMWSINKMVESDTSAWTGWTSSGTEAWATWSGFTYDQRSTGAVRVHVSNYTGFAAPNIVARATITPARGQPIEKWIEVTLRKRSKFANGLVARNSLLFRGNNASVDSWNSDPDTDPTTPAIPYGNGVRRDGGTAGSISVSVNAMLINNADIWGYAATGGSPPSVGSNGSVLGADSPTGLPNNVDPNRVSTDFSANMEAVAAPSGKVLNVLGGVSHPLTLPLPLAQRDPDGRYYYQISGIRLVNETLRIASGDVVIILQSGHHLEVGGGSGAVRIDPGATLAVYAAGNVSIGGQGIANGDPGANGAMETSEVQQPIRFQVYGTAPDSDNNTVTSHQSIDVKGNGAFSGVIYAPNADVFVNGNGDVLGSIVAGNITMVGNAAFHYDESLGNADTGSPFGITRWKELTSASERAAYAAKLSF